MFGVFALVPSVSRYSPTRIDAPKSIAYARRYDCMRWSELELGSYLAQDRATEGVISLWRCKFS